LGNANRDRFPVDLNTADREMLLRIPGLGVRSVGHVLKARVHGKPRLSDLRRLAGSIQRLRPFADHSSARLLDRAGLRTTVSPPAEQLSLFG
jgi:predicted DNA-binding helix-hairpin-helix protein